MNISIIKLLTLLLLPVVYKIIYLIAADNWGDEIEYIQVLFHQISVGYYYLLEFAFVGSVYIMTNRLILNRSVMNVQFWIVIAVFVVLAIVQMIIANDNCMGCSINWIHLLVATVLLIVVLCVIYYVESQRLVPIVI